MSLIRSAIIKMEINWKEAFRGGSTVVSRLAGHEATVLVVSGWRAVEKIWHERDGETVLGRLGARVE